MGLIEKESRCLIPHFALLPFTPSTTERTGSACNASVIAGSCLLQSWPPRE